MATHSSILACRIPWTEEPEWATVHGVTQSWTRLSGFTHTHTHTHTHTQPSYLQGVSPGEAPVVRIVGHKDGILWASFEEE